MASRNWLFVLGLASMLLVGWFVGMQSITNGEEVDDIFGPAIEASPEKPLEDIFGSPDDPAQKPRVKTTDKTLINDIFSDDAPSDESDQVLDDEAMQVKQIELELAAIAKRQKELRQQREQLKAQRERDAFMGKFWVQGGRDSDVAKIIRDGMGRGTRIIWEYKSDYYDDSDANALGKEGWELVSVYTQQNGKERAVYKRPVEPNNFRATGQGRMPWEIDADTSWRRTPPTFTSPNPYAPRSE
jgi:hypothetical protein